VNSQPEGCFYDSVLDTIQACRRLRSCIGTFFDSSCDLNIESTGGLERGGRWMGVLLQTSAKEYAKALARLTWQGTSFLWEKLGLAHVLWR